MKFYIVLLVVCFLGNLEAKTRKKSTKDDLALAEPKPLSTNKKSTSSQPPAAIVAIEIVDPKENKTNSKNSKRTIDSSLGYGYKSFYGATNQQPKFEIYKYSQHDIPPYHGPKNIFRHGIKSNNFDFQQSVSYNLPSRQHHQERVKYSNVPQQETVSQYYQPGTTLFSTVNQQGHLGDISSQVPQAHDSQKQVPVIIFRVYPNQIADASNGLYPNLPKSHPLASNLNGINLQSLLSNYLQNMVLAAQPQQSYQQEYQQPSYQPQYEQNYHYQYQQQPSTQHVHQPASSAGSGLLTHENYPSEKHTNVIFKTHSGQIRESNTETDTPLVETKTIKIQVPDGVTGVQVQEQEPQYDYSNQLADSMQGYQYVQSGGSQYYYTQPSEQVYESVYQQPQEDSQQQHQQVDLSQSYDTTKYVQYEQVQEQPQPQQQTVYQQAPSGSEENTQSPYNYHAHQKRRIRNKNKTRRVQKAVTENDD